MSSSQPPPLEGVRVLDLSRVLPGPFASMMLADLGADVIKIEHPKGGDLERASSPLTENGESYRFGMLNRNKRSIAIDLKSEDGRDIVHRLALEADVVLEGFRPGVAQDLGVDPATLRAINPRLVYASISGYGQDGPYAELPGHDINYLAMAGLLRYFGDDSGPRVPWLPIADIGGGAAMAVAGVLAALVRRATTGEGDFLDLGMAEGALYWQQTRAQWSLATGTEPTPQGLPVTGALPGYGIYRTSDDDWLSLGCLEPVFWQRLCELLEWPEALSRQHEVDGRAELDSALRDKIAMRSRDEWFDLMRESGIPAAPCYTIKEALDDEHFRARGRVGSSAAHDHIRSPFHFVNTPQHPTEPAPVLGQNTDDVLIESGFDAQAIANLRERGVIR